MEKFGRTEYEEMDDLLMIHIKSIILILLANDRFDFMEGTNYLSLDKLKSEMNRVWDDLYAYPKNVIFKKVEAELNSIEKRQTQRVKNRELLKLISYLD